MIEFLRRYAELTAQEVRQQAPIPGVLDVEVTPPDGRIAIVVHRSTWLPWRKPFIVVPV